MVHSSDSRACGWERVTLSDAASGAGMGAEVDVEAPADAPDHPARISERQASIPQLRWFGGMTGDEIAAHLGLRLATFREERTA